MPEPSITELFDLSGKTAIVTGGGGGIGEGIAARLAEAGASVLIADINLEAANQTVEKIKSRGGSAYAIGADISSAIDCKKLVETAVKISDRLDILVNNAGIYNIASTLKVTENMWNKVMDVNLKGLFFLSQAAAQAMIKAGNGGRIINIASKNAIHPTLGMPHYDTSKGGVLQLTRAMALELGRYNIFVNAVLPGAIATPGTDELSSVEIKGPQKDFYQALGGDNRVPFRRVGRPDDIARAVLFLASAADYMTGTSLLVDGGFTLT